MTIATSVAILWALLMATVFAMNMNYVKTGFMFMYITSTIQAGSFTTILGSLLLKTGGTAAAVIPVGLLILLLLALIIGGAIILTYLSAYANLEFFDLHPLRIRIIVGFLYLIFFGLLMVLPALILPA